MPNREALDSNPSAMSSWCRGLKSMCQRIVVRCGLLSLLFPVAVDLFADVNDVPKLKASFLAPRIALGQVRIVFLGSSAQLAAKSRVAAPIIGSVS